MASRSLDFLDPVLDTCRARVRSMRHETLRVRTKDNGTPVSDLDLWVEERLIEAIRREYSEASILSEESFPNPDAIRDEICFVIDPIDGTKELLAGRSDFGISVCLLYRGRPAAGLLDLPLAGVRLTATSGDGAQMNGRPLRLTEPKSLRSTQLASSRSQLDDPIIGALLRQLPVAGVTPVSAFTPKIARVLGGQCDIAIDVPSPGKFTYLWDFASAALLLMESGGALISFDGVDLLRALPYAHEGGWIAGRSLLCQDLRREWLALSGRR